MMLWSPPGPMPRWVRHGPFARPRGISVLRFSTGKTHWGVFSLQFSPPPVTTLSVFRQVPWQRWRKARTARRGRRAPRRGRGLPRTARALPSVMPPAPPAAKVSLAAMAGAARGGPQPWGRATGASCRAPSLWWCMVLISERSSPPIHRGLGCWFSETLSSPWGAPSLRAPSSQRQDPLGTPWPRGDGEQMARSEDAPRHGGAPHGRCRQQQSRLGRGTPRAGLLETGGGLLTAMAAHEHRHLYPFQRLSPGPAPSCRCRWRDVGVQSDPLGCKVASLGVQSDPPGFKVSSLGVQSDSLGMQSEPLGCKVTPQGCKVSPWGSKSHPLGCKVTLWGAKSHPLGCKVTLRGSKSHPLGCKGTPQGCKGTPQGYQVTSWGAKSHPLGCKVALRGSKSHPLGCKVTP